VYKPYTVLRVDKDGTVLGEDKAVDLQGKFNVKTWLHLTRVRAFESEPITEPTTWLMDAKVPPEKKRAITGFSKGNVLDPYKQLGENDAMIPVVLRWFEAKGLFTAGVPPVIHLKLLGIDDVLGSFAAVDVTPKFPMTCGAIGKPHRSNRVFWRIMRVYDDDKKASIWGAVPRCFKCTDFRGEVVPCGDLVKQLFGLRNVAVAASSISSSSGAKMRPVLSDLDAKLFT